MLPACFRYARLLTCDFRFSTNVLQHRFTGLISADFLKAATEELQELAPEGHHAAAVAGSKLVGYAGEVIKGVAGHPLHRYLGVAGLEQANTRQAKIDWTAVKDSSKLSDESRRIIVLQIIEGLKDKEENAQSDKEQLKREQEARANLQKIIGQIEKTSDTIKKKFSVFTWLGFGKNPTDQAKAMGLSMAVVIGSQDGDAAVLPALGETVGELAGLTAADISKAQEPHDINTETAPIPRPTLADNKDKTSSTKDSVVDKATNKSPNADQEKPSNPNKLPVIPGATTQKSLLRRNVGTNGPQSKLLQNNLPPTKPVKSTEPKPFMV